MAIMLTMAAFAATAVSCGKDDNEEETPHGVIHDNAITVTLENGGGDSLNLVGCAIKLVTDDDHAFVETLFGVNGFTLMLPASVDDEFLSAIERGGIPEGLMVSDPKVKLTTTYLEAYREGQYLGDFYHGSGEWKGYLVYADGEVEISGSVTDDEGTWTYDAQLKAGWNVMYEKIIEKENWDDNEYEMITRVPEDARWGFDLEIDGM
jgi:hypothetical protein